MDLQKILLIIDIVLFSIIGLSLLVGYIKGFKASLIGFISSMTGIVLLLIFLDPLCKLLIEVELPLNWFGFEAMSMKDFVMAGLKEVTNTDIASDSALGDFAGGVMIMSLRITVLYIGVTLNFIPALIIKLILKGILGKTNGKKVFIGRFGGMALQGAKCIVYLGLYLFPLYGIISVAQDVRTETLAYNEVKGVETDPDLLKIFDVIESIDTSMAKKAINKSGDLVDWHVDREFLGYLTRIKTPKGTINWVSETELFELAVKGYVATSSGEEIDYLQLIIDNQELIADFLKNSDILPVLMPPLMELLITQDLGDIKITQADIDDIDWAKEREPLSKIFAAICELAELNKDQMDQYTKWFETDEAVVAMGKLGGAIGDSEVCRLIIKIVMEQMFSEIGDSSFINDLVSKIDLKREGIDLKSDFESIAIIINNLNRMNFFEDEKHMDGDLLADCIVRVFQLNILGSNRSEIFTTIINEFKIQETIAEWGFDFELDLTGVDWDDESVALGQIAKRFLALSDKLEGANLDDLIVDATPEKQADLVNFFEAIIQSEVFSKVAVSILDYSFKQAGLEDYQSEWFKSLVAGDIAPSALHGEFDKLVDILVLLNEGVDLDFGSASDEQIDKIFEILEVANTSKLLNINQAIVLLNQLIAQTGLEENGTPISASVDTLTTAEWNDELPILKEIIKSLLSLDDFENIDLNEKEDELVALMDNLQQSKLMSGLVNPIIANFVEALGYDLSISSLDLSSVDWSVEIGVILDLVDDFSEINNSITAIPNLSEILNKASTSVIATELIGSALNDAFSSTYPESNGLVPNKYDFTDKDTLKDSSGQITSLISFGESLKELFEAISNDSLDETIIASFTEKYGNLETTTTRPCLTDDLMASILGYASGNTVTITAEDFAQVDYNADSVKVEEGLIALKEASNPVEIAQAVILLNESFMGRFIASNIR